MDYPCHPLCVHGMRLVGHDLIRMFFALTAGSNDLIPPLYTIDGTTYALPCKTCNPDWHIPTEWRRAEPMQARQWAQEHASG